MLTISIYVCSEEIGRIYVGDRRRAFHSDRVVGMVVDEVRPDVMHVLTNYPLELHTLYPVKHLLYSVLQGLTTFTLGRSRFRIHQCCRREDGDSLSHRFRHVSLLET